MNIKRTISFYLQKVYAGRNTGESQIRMRVRWEGNVLQFNCGYTIGPQKWDAEQMQCRRGTTNAKGIAASEINRALVQMEDAANDVFKYYEVHGDIPSKADYRDEFNRLSGRGTQAAKKRRTLDDYFLEFITTQGSVNGWSDSTVFKFRTLRKHLREFDEGLTMEDFRSPMFARYIDFLLRSLGMQNVTVLKEWKLLKWFLRWAGKQGYLDNKDFEDFAPRLRTVADKEVVYLTWEELMRVYGLRFPLGKKYLERTRDVFCFQCFTSLRYSDVSRLKRSDIGPDAVTVVTRKTGDTLRIELNKYSRAILAKYADDERPLPVVSNQRMNEWLKEVAYLAGIDTPVTTVAYRGAERIEQTRPKYELIGTHTGRRTFICNALAMGIPAATVMEWTGHSDYKAMRPYIRIADTEKARAMRLFDEK